MANRAAPVRKEPTMFAAHCRNPLAVHRTPMLRHRIHSNDNKNMQNINFIVVSKLPVFPFPFFLPFFFLSFSLSPPHHLRFFLCSSNKKIFIFHVIRLVNCLNVHPRDKVWCAIQFDSTFDVWLVCQGQHTAHSSEKSEKRIVRHEHVHSYSCFAYVSV